MSFLGPYAFWLKYGLVAVFIGSFYAFAYTRGVKSATADCDADKLAAAQKYQANYQKAVTRGDVLAKKASALETESTNRAKEAIKNVPQVTTGKSCLNSAAVRMLNHRGGDAVPETPSKPDAESPADAAADTGGATDTDVAYWAADVISQYEIAAARINALIDYLNEKGQ